MSTTAYDLSSAHIGFVSHYAQKLHFLRDIDEYEELRVHIKSGDYFVQLATILDAMQDAQMSSQDMTKVLNRVIQDLLYLQAHYNIREKS